MLFQCGSHSHESSSVCSSKQKIVRDRPSQLACPCPTQASGTPRARKAQPMDLCNKPSGNLPRQGFSLIRESFCVR